ncbi:hypothetical protein [uncultured Xanthomonas sp.]|uniref:hypothetical protein n=1 Tax=uncultured Xanthomonas sp. TaxID=152831 RepID=UPI0025E44719|nr:hypothetical protein [uncultured Xanthomonas sp.]
MEDAPMGEQGECAVPLRYRDARQRRYRRGCSVATRRASARQEIAKITRIYRLFFLVWENRHSYLDIRNGAATRT